MPYLCAGWRSTTTMRITVAFVLPAGFLWLWGIVSVSGTANATTWDEQRTPEDVLLTANKSLHHASDHQSHQNSSRSSQSILFVLSVNSSSSSFNQGKSSIKANDRNVEKESFSFATTIHPKFVETSDEAATAEESGEKSAFSIEYRKTHFTLFISPSSLSHFSICETLESRMPSLLATRKAIESNIEDIAPVSLDRSLAPHASSATVLEPSTRSPTDLLDTLLLHTRIETALWSPVLPKRKGGDMESTTEAAKFIDFSSRALRSVPPPLLSGVSISQPHTRPVRPSQVSPDGSERTRGNGNPSMDNIINGIIQLLGGDIKLPHPPSLRLSPPPMVPLPRLPTRINNRGPPNFHFQAPPRPPTHGIANIPHPPPHLLSHPGHFDTIPRPPPNNFNFPSHHPDNLHILPLAQPPTMFPTPSDVSHLLGLHDLDRHLQAAHLQHHPQHSTPTPTSESRPQTHLEHLGGPRDPMRESSETQLPAPTSRSDRVTTSQSTVVLIHESPVTSGSEKVSTEDITPTAVSTHHYEEGERERKKNGDGGSGELEHATANYEEKAQYSTTLSERSKISSTDTDALHATVTGVPTGPVSDWLPAFLNLSESANVTRTTISPVEEPEIITEPTEKSIFDITVMNFIGSANHPLQSSRTEGQLLELPSSSDLSETRTVRQTSSLFHTVEETTLAVTPLPASTSHTRTRKPEHSKEPDVVYGKRTFDSIVPTPTVEPSSLSALGISSTDDDTGVILTLSGKGTLSPGMAQTWATAPQNTSPTGRPVVVPVEIDDVRPVVGQPPVFRPGVGSPPSFPPKSGPSSTTSTRSSSKQSTPPSRQSQSKPSFPRRRPPYRPRSNSSIVRIDTCIVGDETTCDPQLNEWCKTELSISSCHCRPGFTRSIPRGPCTPIVVMGLTLKLDRIGDKRLVFNRNYRNTDSEEYQTLEYEAKQAIRSLFAKSSFSRVFLDVTVNKFQAAGSKVLVNTTLQLQENGITRVPSVKRVIQHEVVNMINRRNSNIGDSRLYVDGLLNSGLAVEDVNECSDALLNDCSKNGICENVFGTFHCICKPGYTDKYPDTKRKSGRSCSACAPDYCNNKGECRINNGQRKCSCRGKYIGARCDIDGEVLGVALGATVTAVIIIILTLICLCLWNRRWKREQQKAEVLSQAQSAGSLGYLSKASTIAPGCRVSVEDRLRWQHIADAVGDIYVQPDTTIAPKTPPVFTTRPYVRSPNTQEENPYIHTQRPRSRGTLYGQRNQGPYEFGTQKRDAYTSAAPFYKIATLLYMYS